MSAPASITCTSVAPDTSNLYIAWPPSGNVIGSALNVLISGGLPATDVAAVLSATQKMVTPTTAMHKHNRKMLDN
jgi:hypothetical protein